jgi:hypothetical protein
VGRLRVSIHKKFYKMTEKLFFDKTEEAIWFGHLLGDGHIQKRGQSYRTKIEHSYDQLDYVKWKYNKLKRLAFDIPKSVTSKHDFKSTLFYLKSGTYLKKYHDLFYQPYVWKSKQEIITIKEKIRYRKTITKRLINNLPNDPLLLAVWFMDDGSQRSDCFAGRLATQSFSKEEHFLLQDYLLSSFNIKTNIVLHKAIDKSYYLSITAKHNNFSNFIDLITPFVKQVPCMHYKIQRPRND